MIFYDPRGHPYICSNVLLKPRCSSLKRPPGSASTVGRTGQPAAGKGGSAVGWRRRGSSLLLPEAPVWLASCWLTGAEKWATGTVPESEDDFRASRFWGFELWVMLSRKKSKNEASKPAEVHGKYVKKETSPLLRSKPRNKLARVSRYLKAHHCRTETGKKKFFLNKLCSHSRVRNSTSHRVTLETRTWRLTCGLNLNSAKNRQKKVLFVLTAHLSLFLISNVAHRPAADGCGASKGHFFDLKCTLMT